MTLGDRNFIGLNLQDHEAPKFSKTKEDAFQRKDDPALESLSDNDLKKLAKGIEARLKEIDKAITESAIQEERPKPVLAFSRSEEEKKLSAEDEIRLIRLREKKSELDKVLAQKKLAKIDTSALEADIQQTTEEISNLERGIAEEDSLGIFPSE